MGDMPIGKLLFRCTKLLQARGNTLVPMLAQVTGAAINIVLDSILIFGRLGAPALGVTGAALATVAGQWAAMAITLAAVCRDLPQRPGPHRHAVPQYIIHRGAEPHPQAVH